MELGWVVKKKRIERTLEAFKADARVRLLRPRRNIVKEEDGEKKPRIKEETRGKE